MIEVLRFFYLREIAVELEDGHNFALLKNIALTLRFEDLDFAVINIERKRKSNQQKQLNPFKMPSAVKRDKKSGKKPYSKPAINKKESSKIESKEPVKVEAKNPYDPFDCMKEEDKIVQTRRVLETNKYM